MSAGLIRAGVAALAVALFIGVAPAQAGPTGGDQPTRQAVALVAESDYSSFFGDASLSGSGWAACPEPVTWSVDMGRLSPAAAKREMARLQKALGLWSRYSGVPLEFAGRQPLVYDNTSYQLRAADNSASRTRHIYIGFYGGKEVAGLSGNVVGLARPTSVLAGELISGMAVFRRGYVLREQSEEPRHLTHLYLHELGHIFGLGHATSPENVMYPTLGTMTDLGPGDRAGARDFAQECTTQPE
ncbi:MAG: matrixin family metalloprotease [Candidatus Nanopelagicales bacterium]